MALRRLRIGRHPAAVAAAVRAGATPDMAAAVSTLAPQPYCSALECAALITSSAALTLSFVEIPGTFGPLNWFGV